MSKCCFCGNEKPEELEAIGGGGSFMVYACKDKMGCMTDGKSYVPVNITRPTGGMSINKGISEDVLCDANNEPMVFKNKLEAIAYLKAFGFKDDEMDDFTFPLVETYQEEECTES